MLNHKLYFAQDLQWHDRRGQCSTKNEEVKNTEHEEFKLPQQRRILQRLKLAGLANHASKISSATITSNLTRTLQMILEIS